MSDDMEMNMWVVPSDASGMRLDAVLAAFLPEYGIQARRRLCRDNRVFIGDSPRAAGFKVRAGDCVRVDLPVVQTNDSLKDAARVLASKGEFIAFEKPCGLHTVKVQGSPEPSLEDYLPQLCGFDGVKDGRTASCFLVNRLDRDTSGIVLGALSEKGQEQYRLWEREGAVRKTYVALVRGEVKGTLYLDAGLDTANRRKTALTGETSPDVLRHTRACPLKVFEAGGLCFTLLEAVIQRGSRHQIRAHLAGAGFPIVGDGLYGESGDDSDIPQGLLAAGQTPRLFLHHALIESPALTVECAPGWRFGPEE